MSRYLTIEEARKASGLRLVGMRGVPSPWTEAARGIFHVKGLRCQYAARGEGEPADALVRWAGDSSIPVVAWEGEKLRTGWSEILLLAERLAPDPALIPADEEARVDLFGIGHEICGEWGLGWCVRLLMLERSLGGGPSDGAHAAFPPDAARHLGDKYGYTPGCAEAARQRVELILAALDARLAKRPFLVGRGLTAADIYWATFANLLTPLPEEELPAVPLIRDVYAGGDPDVMSRVTDRLRRHQRRVYEEWLELPVPL